jgi:serine protease
LNDIEPNNSLATAQVIAATNATVRGTLASTTDQDFFRITVGAGKTVVARLSPGATSGMGLSALMANGQTLVSITGAVGQTAQLSIRNTGSTALPITFQVRRASGAAGAYTLVFSQ